ncbi:unnamed protein product, partial [Discosporangium mesarthrocarpum]
MRSSPALRPRCLGRQVTPSSSSRIAPHTKKGANEAIQAEPWEKHHETQPSNSPDLNVNDLGFVHSIQQLKEKISEGLVEAMLKALDIYPLETLERWHSLFTVYGENLGSEGDNNYKIPYSAKEQARRKGGLP